MTTHTQANQSLLSPKRTAYLEAMNRKRQRDAESTPAERWTILLSATLLGIVFDLFFNGQHFGISVFLFALLTVLAVRLSTKEYRQPLFSSFLLVSVLALCLSYALFNNDTLRVLNALAIPLGMTAYVLSARYGDWGRAAFRSLGLLMNKLVPQIIETSPKLFAFAAHRLADTRERSAASETRNQILKGILLAAPLLTLVLVLLTNSDAVFSRILSDRFRFFDEMQLEEIVSHTLLIAATTFYFFGYLWSLKYEHDAEISSGNPSKPLSTVSAMTVMSLMCAVYMLFTVVQFAYLYSPGASLPTGLTYADYARRGFFELVAAAFVNMAVILGIASKTKDSPSKLSRPLLICHSLLTVFTLNLLVSAFYRMHLYEAAYGFTELRLFVQFFMAFMAISLLALLVWVWMRKFPLFRTILVTAITVYVALNYVNVDRLIAQRNLDQYLITGHIDIQHFNSLSVDALPAIEAAHLLPVLKGQLSDRFMLNRSYIQEEYNHWFEYNYGIERYLRGYASSR